MTEFKGQLPSAEFAGRQLALRQILGAPLVDALLEKEGTQPIVTPQGLKACFDALCPPKDKEIGNIGIARGMIPGNNLSLVTLEFTSDWSCVLVSPMGSLQAGVPEPSVGEIPILELRPDGHRLMTESEKKDDFTIYQRYLGMHYRMYFLFPRGSGPGGGEPEPIPDTPENTSFGGRRDQEAA